MTAPFQESSYGSDTSGLVWAYRFAPGRSGTVLPSDEVEAWLGARTSADDPGRQDFLWLHFSVTNAASVHWMTSHITLPESFRESWQAASSTRVEVVDDWMLGVLNDLSFFSSETSEASTVSLCANPRLLVSARSSPLRSIDHLRAAVKAGARFRSPVELVAHLLRDQAGLLSGMVQEAAKKVDATEDQVIAGHVGSCRATLGSLRRRVIRLQRLLAPEPAALFRLLNRPPPWIDAEDLQDLRQSAEDLAAAVTESTALGERVRLLQEELFALINEQTNRTLFVLTVVTVLALPLTILSGLMGMNVGGVPFGQHPAGFWIASGIALTISFIGAWLALGKRSDR